MTTCKECGVECLSGNSISFHLKKSHCMTYADYLIKHDYDGKQPICKCGKLIAYKPGGFSRFCSRSCASSGDDNAMGRLKGEKSPNFGQKRTPEQRANYSQGARKRWDIHGDMLREMMKTPEYRQAQAESRYKLAEQDPTFNARRIEASNRFWTSGSDLSKQRRKEASDRAIHLLEQGLIGPHAPFKTCWFDNPFTGQAEFMHSSWETAFLTACIASQYPVTKVHGIQVSYVAPDGSDHVYLPDFRAIEENVLFEVKGLMRENDEAKLSACHAWCSINGYELIVVGAPPPTE
jgi:hypothetical protein